MLVFMTTSLTDVLPKYELVSAISTSAIEQTIPISLLATLPMP